MLWLKLNGKLNLSEWAIFWKFWMRLKFKQFDIKPDMEKISNDQYVRIRKEAVAT
jgi:hypothetical protein